MRASESAKTLLAQGLKKCSRCGEVKAIEQFQKDKRATCGVTSNCKTCDKERSAANRLTAEGLIKSREHNLKHARKLRATPEGKQKLNAATKKACAKAYATPEGKAKVLALVNKRRAAYTYPNEEEKIRAIYELATRHFIDDGIPRHVDHIVPLNGKAACGLHVVANLQILTAEENLQKSNRLEI